MSVFVEVLEKYGDAGWVEKDAFPGLI